MSGAEGTSIDAPAWNVAAAGAPSSPAPRRGRLFRKYALLFIALVGATLLITSAFDFWFSYQENKAALIHVQQEKAQAAAGRIEDFIGEIERQIGWTTHAQWAAAPIDQRRQDYVRLLRQVPAITELSQLDAQGKEQLKVSRLSMDSVGSGADFSQSPAFIEAKAHRRWFSPVYFRKQSEPYMTLAIARDGKDAGVTVAEINLKLIWDVITAMKIGQNGYAYVVDGRGRLVAYPDISLVLRDTDLSALPQVAAALREPAGGHDADDAGDAVRVAKNLAGRAVLTAHAAIDPPGWLVFVEVPLKEAFAPLYGAAWRTAGLLAAGLIAAALVALLLARRMTGPIRAIAAGAERIGMGELDRRIDIHTGDELEALAGQFNRMAGDLQKSYADLEQRVKDRTAELSEALEQQTATAEVLGVINSSPGDLAPVFDAILEKAHSLCGAAHGHLTIYDGQHFRAVAMHDVPEAFAELLRQPFRPGVDVAQRLLRGENVIQIPDMAALTYAADDRVGRAAAEVAGVRTILIVALRKEASLLGYITAHRVEVRPFTDKEIALLQNFAAQAVIAMENARLITETREALEQQTATAEVLGVINSSPGELAPVFDAILEKATRVCEAACGQLAIYDGEFFRFVAAHGLAGFATEQLGRDPMRPEWGLTWPLQVDGENTVQFADVKDSDAYRSGHESARRFVDIGGGRTLLSVALRKEAKLLGTITVYRFEPRPFNDKQIALLENFAAQAVIAMENARLITETREALEQQTATAEVLCVINASPGDLAPVFDAMLEKATRLCGAAYGHLWTYDGELLRPFVSRGEAHMAAWFQRLGPRRPSPHEPIGRVLAGEKFLQFIDALEEEGYKAAPDIYEQLKINNIRTILLMPLRAEDRPLGLFVMYRQEVRPFSDKEIALLQNFAAQAVIAMENARLITETREALEQQTATAEVLQVINASPGDLAPVFDAMLEKAMRLCDASFGIMFSVDHDSARIVATRDVPAALQDFLVQSPPGIGPDTIFGRAILERAVLHTADVREGAQYRNGQPLALTAADLAGVRALLMAPLIKDDGVLGVFAIFRREVRPFTDKQIALLQNFAAQAVIAMENARLITETREALEQQTATAEVLGVINSSPGDLAPVFEAVVDKAMRLCEAACGHLLTYDGQHVTPAAVRGEREYIEYMRGAGSVSPGTDTPVGRALRGEPVVHIVDAREEEIYRTNEGFREQADMAGFRSMLVVGLRREEALLGTLTVFRQEVRPFSDKNIALLQNFAAQAVIAMENARLITETRERSRELQQSLEYQTATSDVLKVITRSNFDLQPVLDFVVETACRLCGVEQGIVYRLEGGTYRWAAGYGLDPDYEANERRLAISPGRDTLVGRTAEEGRVVHILDAWSDPLYAPKADLRMSRVHTLLGVPLLREGVVVGVITLGKEQVAVFSQQEIELVSTFADQAVIAIENVRLFDELRERTRDLQESLEIQTAISDVLRVISGSGFDLDPVLQTVVSTAIRLCRADHAAIFRNYDGEFRWAASEGLPSQYEAIERELRVQPGTGSAVGRAALEGRPVHILDAWNDPLYELKDDARTGGVRTLLGVPLLRDGMVIGVIGLARERVEAFTDKQIELVATFADQAVIAIENARLLGELRSRTDELARSVEELKALSEVGQAVSSTLELRAVLSTVLNRSVALADADAGAIFRYRPRQRSFRFVEAVGYTEAMVHDVRELDVAENVTGLGIAIANRAPLQIPDLRERPANPLRDQAVAAGYRSVLIVPLVGADRILGATVLQRRAVGEFPEATVRLMQTLAAQSVLAIQNARLFREIADKSEELRLASQHKSQFLANMSHELRTPLNAILGYTELLADGLYGELTPRAAGVLERVQNNGKHLLALINDVLDLAKIEAGQLSLTFEDYALPDVVQSVVSATESLASGKGLKLTADIMPGLPPGHGDARRLAQVLLNLTGNAIKFTDAGEVAIGAAAEDGHFLLTVRDTGPGIAAEDQAKIFEEFQQVDNSNTRKKGGTGLGLAISKRMVEMQGGTISVESELGKGATFRVSLPIRVEDVPEELMGAA
ncbi:MAG: GAF domain-containing protein [Thiohalocapsa sp.]